MISVGGRRGQCSLCAARLPGIRFARPPPGPPKEPGNLATLGVKAAVYAIQLPPIFSKLSHEEGYSRQLMQWSVWIWMPGVVPSQIH